MEKIKSLIKENFALVLILLLFLFSRLYNIEKIPGSVYWDEASIGYNAYSVLQTGKDEWGETLPLHFRAFGEFKLPVYVYSVLLSEMVFGLTALAVRLPAVVFGTLSVLGLYLVVNKLTKNKTISLLSCFLFTITPWFFVFSRTGYEATAGLAFFIFAIYFWLLSGKRKWNILISVIFFIISSYSYNSFRILTPLVLGPILFAFGLKVVKEKKRNGILIFLLSILVIFLSIIPIYKLYSKDSGLSRLQTVGTSKNLINNYLENFSPEFLFVSGDTNPRSQVPGSSQLYYLDAIFILLGLGYIYKKKDYKYLIPLIGLILSPLPAAITKENPHALRAILAAPVFAVISAFGITYFLEILKTRKRTIFIGIVVLYLSFFIAYFGRFIRDYNSLSFEAWQLTYKQVIEDYFGSFSKYDNVYISDQRAQPYIFVLFYEKINPNDFIDTKKLNPVSDWGFSTVSSFGKYHFIKDCNLDTEKNSLVICPI